MSVFLVVLLQSDIRRSGWVSEKYPKIVQLALEEDGQIINGVEQPIDATQSNPNSYEFDILYRSSFVSYQC